jgi:hypothetical protein
LDDTKEIIKKTLIGLADGTGYDPRKLFSVPMLDLLPSDWDQLTRAASCDELIREYEPRVKNQNHAAALQAALDIEHTYASEKLKDRLVAFRLLWHQEHPEFPLEIDLSNHKSTYESTRKWWEAGRDHLTRSLYTEIERRNRVCWPQPKPESLERIKAANQSSAHPVEKIVREEQEPGSQEHLVKRRRQLPGRPLAIVVIMSVSAIGALIWLGISERWFGGTSNTQAATCSDVGNNSRGVLDPTWAGPFRAAYQAAGGEAELGCPRTDDSSGYVHQWGGGTSQDLQGGRAGIARIMALDPEHVIVMAGSYYHDYTDLGSGNSDPNAAQEEGYPTSNPFECGSARLVLLADSQHNQTPGAMVTAAHSKHFMWLPKLIWLAYKAIGGPLGPLGQPTGQEQPIPSGIRQQFEYGDVTLAGTTTQAIDQYGHAEHVSPRVVTQFQTCISGH